MIQKILNCKYGMHFSDYIKINYDKKYQYNIKKMCEIK